MGFKPRSKIEKDKTAQVNLPFMGKLMFIRNRKFCWGNFFDVLGRDLLQNMVPGEEIKPKDNTKSKDSINCKYK